MEFRVRSLRVEKIVTYDDREDEYEDNIKYILNIETGRVFNIQKYELELYTINGDCCSGWCAASYGYGNLKKVKHFTGHSHKPIKDLSFDLNVNLEKETQELDDIENNIFSLSYDGGCNYYANGETTVNMSLFECTPRLKDKRIVWIFKGDSNLGKSYLSHIIANQTDKEVYETDSQEYLKEKISEDIVVVGNKYNFSIDEVKDRLFGDNEIVVVDFSKTKEK